jgi:hypothetical protein
VPQETRLDGVAILAVPAGDHMEIREIHTQSRPDWPSNKLGAERARPCVPSFCAERERRSLLDLLRRSGNPENELAFQTEKSCRNSSFVGGFYDRPPYSDGLAAIAAPVCWREKIYGAINLVWLKNSHTVDHMMRHRLTNLQPAASENTADLPRKPRQSWATRLNW